MDPRTPDSPDPASRHDGLSAEDAPTIGSRSAPDPEAPTLHADSGHRVGAAKPFPSAIGHYRILGRLGEGGMGIVYEAEQEHPKRRVALKVIRGGSFIDDSQVRLFQREVDTLARLKHPNIASIYDAGRTEAGEHFFAMELVHGQTLANFMRSRTAPVEGAELRFRLRLFQSICGAVNYAHQRGVIHRDLKPSNIFVSESESTETSSSRSGALPEIKILDFGLARITDTDVEAATAVSEIGVIKGTLPYMSPEQARGNPDEIDVRSDVYALGIILFEMLTSIRPYDTQKSSIMEAVRIICEQPAATLRASWKGARAPDADLGTITGKALEKESVRRYGSAAAFSEDIERYLDSRPILARAPSAMYQLSKFAQRNRTLVAGVIATVIALVAGVVVSTNFGLREAAQRRVAEQAQKNTEAVAKFQEEMLAGIDAEKMGVALTTDLAERLRAGRLEQGASPAQAAAAAAGLANTIGTINTTDAALRVIDVNILERAITTARTQFATQPLVQAQLLGSIGITYRKLGLYDKAEPPMLAARALLDSVAGPGDPRSLEAAGNVAELYVELGRTELAEPMMLKILELQRRASGGNGTAQYRAMNSLGQMYTDLERLAEAESLFAIALSGNRRAMGEDDPTTLSILNNYGWALTVDGKHAEAEPLAKAALTGRRRVLGNDHFETMQSVNNLGVLYSNMGRHKEAEPLYLEDYERSRRLLGDQHPDVLVSMSNLGRAYIRSGKFNEAAAILGKALVTSRTVLPPGHFGTGVTALGYGDALLAAGKLREAEAAFLEGHRIVFALRGPEDRGVQHAVGALVEIYDQTGRKAEAAKWRAKLKPAP